MIDPATDNADSGSPSTPHLRQWFAIMDSTTPEKVLQMISPDFVISVQFSRGGGNSQEFVGDRDRLVAYLAQREKNTLAHHIHFGATVDSAELAVGQTTRDGVFEASFNASALVDQGRVQRLLICRTPGIQFPM